MKHLSRWKVVAATTTTAALAAGAIGMASAQNGGAPTEPIELTTDDQIEREISIVSEDSASSPASDASVASLSSEDSIESAEEVVDPAASPQEGTTTPAPLVVMSGESPSSASSFDSPSSASSPSSFDSPSSVSSPSSADS